MTTGANYQVTTNSGSTTSNSVELTTAISGTTDEVSSEESGASLISLLHMGLCTLGIAFFL